MSLTALIRIVGQKLNIDTNEAFEKLATLADIAKDEIFYAERMEYYGINKNIIIDLIREGYISKYFSYECQEEDGIDYAVTLKEQCNFCGKVLDQSKNTHLIRNSYKLNSEFLILIEDKKSAEFNTYIDHNFILNIDKLKDVSHKIIPFIGSGVSVPFNLPGWGELLNKLDNGLIEDDKNLYHKLIEKGDYLKALTFLKVYSGYYREESLIKKDIRQIIIDNYKQPLNKYSHNVCDILKLRSRFILTTNYDNILTEYLVKYKNKLVLPRILSSISDVEELVDEEMQRVVHLHGNIDQINSMIVTKEDYDNLYHSEKTNQILNAIMGNKKLLFIGFSFNDTYFKDLYNKITKQIGGNHFIIVPNLHPFESDEYIGMNLIPIGIKVKDDNSDFVSAIRAVLEQIY